MAGGPEGTAPVTYVTLGVDDLARSTRFYVDTMGWRPLPASTAEVTFLDAGSVRLALYGRDALAALGGLSMPPASTSPPLALSRNVPSREAVADLLARVAADTDSGARVTRPAAPAPWGGVHGWFVDPDGFLWEIAWNPNDEGSPP